MVALRGVHIPSETMMHFPPISGFPLFSKNFQTLENFQNFTFFRTIFWFSSAKISDDHKFWISPLFSLFQYISLPVSRKLVFPPYFEKCPPCLRRNSPAFYILYVYFVSPLLWPWCIYASPNAHTGRPCGLVFSGETFTLLCWSIRTSPQTFTPVDKLKRRGKCPRPRGLQYMYCMMCKCIMVKIGVGKHKRVNWAKQTSVERKQGGNLEIVQK